MRRAGAIVLVSAISMAAATTPQTIVFITSPKRAPLELSSAELRRIFLGQTSRWRDGHRIVLLVRPATTPEGRTFLDRIVQMPEIDYSQWWIGEVFRGEAAAPPRVIETPEKMIRAVAANPDAIGFLSPSDVTRDIAVVSSKH